MLQFSFIRAALVSALALSFPSLLAGCGGDVVNEGGKPSGTGGTGGASASDGGGGDGGSAGESCPANAHEGDSCPTQGVTCHSPGGVCPVYLECKASPTNLMWTTTGPKQGEACDPNPGQVCTYLQVAPDNACQAEKWVATCSLSGKFDVSETMVDPCKTFVCGTQSCQKGVELCQVEIFDTQESYSCAPLSPACIQKTDCGCFGDVSPGCSCTQSKAGDLTLSCFGA